MIVVDSSALIAILEQEPESDRFLVLDILRNAAPSCERRHRL